MTEFLSAFHVCVAGTGLADSVTGHFGQTMKSYINAKSSRLLQSAFPPSSYCSLPKVEAFHSKHAPFTICNGGKHYRQGILLGTKFLAVVQSNRNSGVSGLARVFDYDL